MPRVFWLALIAGGVGLLVYLLSGVTHSSDGDRYVQAFALSAWGLVLAAGLIGSGLKVGAFTRNLALWLAVALAMVAIYQYRYELQDFGSRITAGLIPGSPLSSIDSEGRVTVTLERSPNGHFEGRGSVNGAAVRFLVDTGATTTVLSARDAIAAGYGIDNLRFDIPVSTANGMTEAAGVTADRVELGAIVRERLQIMVAAPGALEQSLLGMNVLGSLSIDIRGDRMILRD